MIPPQRPYEGFYSRPWMRAHGAASAPPGSGLKGVVAGGITGAIQISITYPTDYIKTQLQLEEKGGTRLYSGSLDCVKKTIQSRGVLGLYRGLSILLVGTVPQNSVRFGSFEAFKNYLADADGAVSASKRGLCGVGAGVCEAVLVVTPMETIKVKFINDQRSENPRFKGLFHGIAVILREQGVYGVYRGLAATVLKQGSNQGIRFFVVETCKDVYRGGDAAQPVPKPLVGVFGAVAGAASVFGNNPLDVVKTRMQGLGAARYNSTVHCFLTILNNEGPAAFYKGTLPRLARVCFDVPITFMVYDSVIEFLNKFWH